MSSSFSSTVSLKWIYRVKSVQIKVYDEIEIPAVVLQLDMNVKHFPNIAILKCQNRGVTWDPSSNFNYILISRIWESPKIHHGKIKNFQCIGGETVVILEASWLHWCNIILCHASVMKPLLFLQPLSCPTIYIWDDCSPSQAVSFSTNFIPLSHPLADLSIYLSFTCFFCFLS